VLKPLPIRLNLQLWLSGVILACLVATPSKAPAQANAAPEQVPDGPTRLLRFADISKDRVVFAYAGDLWIASREGGAARRLTSHVGDELYRNSRPTANGSPSPANMTATPTCTSSLPKAASPSA
jgi:hypothetical protein